MADLLPADGVPAMAAASPAPPVTLSALTDPAGGNLLQRIGAFTSQPPVKRMLPWFLGAAALGGVALTWSAMSPSPQRLLYSQLGDSERASVVEALDKAAIDYTIDGQTGALSVDENDFYRARMLVASDGALATPETGSQMLDSLPMGASRVMEGERLRAARERDLMLTIMEIDGVEAVRVHLAEGEKSVFVRDNVAPSASVMVRLARGRQLSQSQVSAIVNLVAGSVPGLAPDAVRVVDQHGRLLSEPDSADSDRLELQARMEEKLRMQVAQLLTPMLGDGNFSTEIQVELDMDEVTSARESYDKDGVVRSETTAASQSTAATQAAGVPGVLANTPPLPTQANPAPPQGTQPDPAQQPPVNEETSASRTFELGREVSVANTSPGGVKRLSVAVAISQSAMKGAKKGEIDQIKQLVSAAVGADPKRGDQVAVITRKFEPVSEEPLPFHETAWFATVVRHSVALLAILLVLLLGVRPLVKALRREPAAANSGDDEPALIEAGDGSDSQSSPPAAANEPMLLGEKVDLAQRLVTEQPDRAVAALRQMLKTPEPDDEPEPEAA
ncbi:MAG: flagellar M-ring protein FliF [Novosphingobium sp.]|nr:flagellar M-ring protein FliF [Novosphingobium sp.]